MHQNGWGVPQSNEEAIRLYALAAEQEISEAMNLRSVDSIFPIPTNG